MAVVREELIALVRRIQLADYDTETNGDRLVKELARSLPYSEISDLIFHQEPPLTAEEVVDRALSYKPIALRSSDEDSHS